MNEISRRDEVSLSGAALRGAPWKTAAIGGGVVSAASFGMGVLTGGGDLVWALGLGVRVTRQARLWSLKHPWKFALLPAGITAVLDYPVQLVLDGEGVFGSAVDALWHGALVYLIAAILTLTMQGRARSSQ